MIARAMLILLLAGCAATAPGPAKMVIHRTDEARFEAAGKLSALAEFCGLDWAALSFQPFMAAERAHGPWSEAGMTVVATAHGIAQAQELARLREAHGTCGDRLRDEARRALAQAYPGS